MVAAALSSAFTASASPWVDADSAASSAVGRIARQSQWWRRRLADLRRCHTKTAPVESRCRISFVLRLQKVDVSVVNVPRALSTRRACHESACSANERCAMRRDGSMRAAPVLSHRSCEQCDLVWDLEQSNTFVQSCVLYNTLYTLHPESSITQFRLRYDIF